MAEDIPVFWVKRAKETLELAQSMKHFETKRELALIALSYDRLARHAAMRAGMSKDQLKRLIEASAIPL